MEEQYIQEQFTKNFLEGHAGNIVIYGTGIHTQRLLEKIHDARIIGLMDAKRTGEVLWGYRVLSYEEVAAVKNVSVVIVARNAVIHIIYRRIEQFCRKNGIEIFDIKGNSLCHAPVKDEEQDCFLLKESDLRKEIQGADIVTFDIFDTLLVRSLMRPGDVFTAIEKSLKDKSCCFAEERIRAEEMFGNGENPNIYEIYRALQKNTGISDAERDELLQLEISWEKRFLRKRDTMCRLLAWAAAQGKEVYLISDMYLPKTVLADILESFDIGGYRDLFVSCEYRKAKQEGLFALFKEQVQTARKTCLHIGDNYYSDIVAAKREGFRTFRIYGAIEMLESSLYSKVIPDCMSMEENIVISNFAVHAYNDPFGKYERNGKLIFRTVDKITELFVAPVIFKYMLWLVQNIQKSSHDVIIFPARDGYLLKKIYERFQKKADELPDSLYLYTSRRAAMVAASRNGNDLGTIMGIDFSGTAQELLKARFGIDEGEIDEETLQDQDECQKIILQHCAAERENYKGYLHGLGLDQYKNAAILDFVAMGSVQEALQRLLDCQFTGYYFLKRSTQRIYLEKLNFYSLYETAGDFQNDTNIYRFYYFLESILTSCEPSFWGIGEYGEKLFYPESRKKEELELLDRIHDGILKYCCELLELLPDIPGAESSIKVYEELLGFFSEDYSVLEKDELKSLRNVDEFMGKMMLEVNR